MIQRTKKYTWQTKCSWLKLTLNTICKNRRDVGIVPAVFSYWVKKKFNENVIINSENIKIFTLYKIELYYVLSPSKYYCIKCVDMHLSFNRMVPKFHSNFYGSNATMICQGDFEYLDFLWVRNFYSHDLFSYKRALIHLRSNTYLNDASHQQCSLY